MTWNFVAEQECGVDERTLPLGMVYTLSVVSVLAIIVACFEPTLLSSLTQRSSRVRVSVEFCELMDNTTLCNSNLDVTTVCYLFL